MTKCICNMFYTDSDGKLHPVTWKDTVFEYASTIFCAILIAYGIIGMVT